MQGAADYPAGWVFFDRGLVDAAAALHYPTGEPARRWVAEHTFSGFGRNRRLSRDFENLAEPLATVIILASAYVALTRLARA